MNVLDVRMLVGTYNLLLYKTNGTADRYSDTTVEPGYIESGARVRGKQRVLSANNEL